MKNILEETTSQKFRRLVPSVLQEYKGHYSQLFMEIIASEDVILRCETHHIEYPQYSSCPACDGELIRAIDVILDGAIERGDVEPSEVLRVINTPPPPIKTLGRGFFTLLVVLLALGLAVGGWWYFLFSAMP